MKLSVENAPLNVSLKIIDISGGMGLKKRLGDLGLTPASTISVIRNDKSGPVLIRVRGTNIALGRGMSRKVQVEVA